MTLYKQLVWVIMIFMLLLFIGAFGLNVRNTQHFLTEQLTAHAQDTATSLGLSLSTSVQGQDKATLQAMVDAIFDRGYYREITLLAADGHAIISRKAPLELDDVPGWLVRWVPLQTPHASADVLSGWHRLGTLYVQSHPGYAYRKLWDALVLMTVWFTLAALILLILTRLGLHLLLRPLMTVERQADKLCQREYEIQEPLPRTRELKRVVQAMNRLTYKVKQSFAEHAESAERLQQLAYRDNLTGLANRRYFETQCQHLLSGQTEISEGVILLLKIHELERINSEQGFAAGDTLLSAVGERIKSVMENWATAWSARLTGSDFAVVLPGAMREQWQPLADALCRELAGLRSARLSDADVVGHVGVTTLRAGEALGQVMARADQALRCAQTQAGEAWHYEAADPAQETLRGRSEWRSLIEAALRERRWQLHQQPVVRAQDGALLHREILLRLQAQGQLQTAGVFLPVAEACGLAAAVDGQVLELLIDYLQTHQTDARFALNLSTAVLHDETFAGALETRLQSLTELGAQLSFEFPEHVALHELDALRRFSERVRDYGHGLALDHFGRDGASFAYLASLRPDYVKLDGSYSAGIDTNVDHQFYVKTLSNIAHSIDVAVIAETVEDRAQWQTLEAMGVDGVQGYVVARPADLTDMD